MQIKITIVIFTGVHKSDCFNCYVVRDDWQRQYLQTKALFRDNSGSQRAAWLVILITEMKVLRLSKL